MSRSPFDPVEQQDDINAKIAIGLERLSEAIRSLSWNPAKEHSLSPIQIRILIFLKFHKQDLGTVSQMAKEFNITKPTISDAVKVLVLKSLVTKVAEADARSYSLKLTPEGDEVANKAGDFLKPVQEQLNNLSEKDKSSFFGHLAGLIHGLNKAGVISVQRSCPNCAFFEKKNTMPFCAFLKQPLLTKDLRLDCPEFEEAT